MSLWVGRLKERISNFQLADGSVPWVLLLSTFLSFGLLISRLGFYWDDWPVIYLIETQGTSGFWDFYQYDRPFSAWTYILFSPMLGVNPLGWHLFTLLLRWMTVVVLWLTLRIMWPQKPLQIVCVAILFAVCPIFKQQPVAVAYSQHWICCLFYFSSILFMLKAQAQPRRLYLFTSFSIGLALLHMMTLEYFLGLELLRPFILFLYQRGRETDGTNAAALKRVISSVWVYVPALIFYILWRLFFLDLAGGDPNRPILLSRFGSSPIQALIDLSQMALRDIIYLFTSWLVAVTPGDIDLRRPFFWATLLTALFAGALIWLLLSRSRTFDTSPEDDSWHMSAVFLGLAALLLGMLPVWMIGRQASVGPLGSRFSFAAMFGVCLILVGLLEWLSSKTRSKIAMIAILYVVAVYANLNNAKSYQQSWEKQRAFYWQMHWRAPYIQPGTALIADGEIFPYVGLYSTSMGIALLYPPVDDPQRLPYWYFSYWERLYHDPDELLAGMVLTEGLRNYSFTGDSQHSLLLQFSPELNLCLQFLSPRDTNFKEIPDSLKGLLSISRLDQIRREPPTPNWSMPENIFGAEPEREWCYFYEKAELARQYGNWSEVIRLLETAQQQGYRPANAYEYLPLVEAYIKQGDINTAYDLTVQMNRTSNKVDDAVCSLWLNAAQENPSSALTSAFDQVEERLKCFD